MIVLRYYMYIILRYDTKLSLAKAKALVEAYIRLRDDLIRNKGRY